MALVGERTHQTPHVSFLRRRAERVLPAGETMEERVVAELNRRGYLGAFGTSDLNAPRTEGLSDEELLVLLAAPDAQADGRNWKLIVRAIQRGTIDCAKLTRLARMERAEPLLAWLVRGVPVSEQTESLRAMATALRPRGVLPSIDYDFGRLERKPARREHGWRRPRS